MILEKTIAEIGFKTCVKCEHRFNCVLIPSEGLWFDIYRVRTKINQWILYLVSNNKTHDASEFAQPGIWFVNQCAMVSVIVTNQKRTHDVVIIRDGFYKELSEYANSNVFNTPIEIK